MLEYEISNHRNRIRTILAEMKDGTTASDVDSTLKHLPKAVSAGDWWNTVMECLGTIHVTVAESAKGSPRLEESIYVVDNSQQYKQRPVVDGSKKAGAAS